MNKIRTYPVKGLTIFMGVVFLGSLAMIILMAFLFDELLVIRILVWVVCGLFVILSSIILSIQLFHYFVIDGDFLIKKGLFISKRIRIKKISRIRVKDDTYFIYDEDNLFGEIPTFIGGAQEVILYLEKSGVKIDWRDSK